MEADPTPTQKGNSGYSELAGGFAVGIAAQSRNADLVRENRRLHPTRGMRLLRRLLRRPQVGNDERAVFRLSASPLKRGQNRRDSPRSGGEDAVL